MTNQEDKKMNKVETLEMKNIWQFLFEADTTVMTNLMEKSFFFSWLLAIINNLTIKVLSHNSWFPWSAILGIELNLMIWIFSFTRWKYILLKLGWTNLETHYVFENGRN